MRELGDVQVEHATDSLDQTHETNWNAALVTCKRDKKCFNYFPPHACYRQVNRLISFLS